MGWHAVGWHAVGWHSQVFHEDGTSGCLSACPRPRQRPGRAWIAASGHRMRLG
ncbi:hypothetical protein FAIPA1_40185 [Frankia sp. AiPs1]